MTHIATVSLHQETTLLAGRHLLGVSARSPSIIWLPALFPLAFLIRLDWAPSLHAGSREVYDAIGQGQRPAMVRRADALTSASLPVAPAEGDA